MATPIVPWRALLSLLAGVALDRCGCCQVCAGSEGQLCDVDRNKNSGELGICGENLVCAKRDDVPGVRRRNAIDDGK